MLLYVHGTPSCEATRADVALPRHQTGEVWEEVSKELEAEGVEPVAFDQTLLQEISQITEAKAEQVLEAQVSPDARVLPSLMRVFLY